MLNRIVLAALILTAQPAAAEVLNACIRPSGAVKIRPASGLCRAGVEAEKQIPTVEELTPPAAPVRFQLVGISTDSFDGGQGIRTYTEACQATFGSTARMCLSVEILDTVSWPMISPPTRAWVHPVYAQQGGPGDASGVLANINGQLSCGGWSWADNLHEGLTIDEKGRFRTPGFLQTCDVARPIACCSPMP